MADAFLNVTTSGQNGDLPAVVDFDAPDSDIKTWAAEAVRTGGIPGIAEGANADFRDYIVDRFPARDDSPARLMLRPKTPFGK